jgi:hypothetical protein
MTTVRVVVLGSARADLVAASLASIRAQGGNGLNIDDASGEYVAFIRAGDLWHERKLVRQIDALESSDAVLSFTGHRKVSPSGREVARVAISPSTHLRPDELLLRCPIEASTVLVRTVVLSDRAVVSANRPGGDIVLWAEIAAHHPVLGLPSVLADVRLDPARHGLGTPGRVEELATIARSRLCRARPVGSVVRRELLLQIDAADEVAVSSLCLLPDAASAAERDELLADVQWAIERQTELREAEGSSWPAGHVEDADQVVDWPDLEVTDRDEVLYAMQRFVADADLNARELHRLLAERQQTIEWLHGQVADRDQTITWLHGEVAARDAQLGSGHRGTDADGHGSRLASPALRRISTSRLLAGLHRRARRTLDQKSG